MQLLQLVRFLKRIGFLRGEWKKSQNTVMQMNACFGSAVLRVLDLRFELVRHSNAILAIGEVFKQNVIVKG